MRSCWTSVRSCWLLARSCWRSARSRTSLSWFAISSTVRVRSASCPATLAMSCSAVTLSYPILWGETRRGDQAAPPPLLWLGRLLLDQLLRDVQCPFERLPRRLCRFGCHGLPVPSHWIRSIIAICACSACRALQSLRTPTRASALLATRRRGMSQPVAVVDAESESVARFDATEPTTRGSS